MMSLSYDIFSGEKKEIFDPLLDDDTVRNKIIRQVATEIARTREILISRPYEQILALMMNADSASEDEHVFVAGSLRRYMQEPNPLPMVTKHKSLDLASRCLVSLGFFREY